MGFLKIKNNKESVKVHEYLHNEGIHHDAPELIYIDGMMIAPDETTFHTRENPRKLAERIEKETGIKVSWK